MMSNLRSLTPKHSDNARNAGFVILIILLITWIFLSRIYKLDSAPAGLFFDESSIGYNAITILRSGQDEHGAPYPVYFKSVGDYKNPVYIYAVAIVFSLFGVSEFSLRFTSVMFFGVALFFGTLLISKIFSTRRIVVVFALIAFGFLPMFFTLSRISFEIISQLAVVSALNFFIWMIFNNPTAASHWVRNGVACGFLLGLSTYTYTTQRLVSSLTLVVLWLVFYKRENFRKLLLISLIFFLALVPFFIFANGNPGVVTERFNELSYVDDPIPPLQKAGLFIQNYKSYWLPDFLIIHGDPNLRHSTGHGGVVFITVFILFIVSFPVVLARARPRNFIYYVIASLVLTPVPAALITEGAPHALRSMLMGFYILLLSCYSVEWLVNARQYRALKTVLVTFLFFGLLFEAVNFELDYFLSYPSRSVEDFGSFDFRSALEFSLEHEPQKVVAVGLPPGGDAHVKFYSEIIENPQGIPIELGEFVEPAPGVCVLFHRKTDVESRLEQYSFSYDGFVSKNKLGPFEKMFDTKKTSGMIKVRCY